MQASELIIRPDGSIYHLHLSPGEAAPHIIFVGDPDRVDRVAHHFEQILHTRRNREFYAVTGRYGGIPMTVISTGIGTDNIDIVWNELDALFNIDFATRSLHPEHTRLKVLRLGTCGGMQADMPVGTLVLSSFALGADGLMPFYAVPEPPQFAAAFTAFKEAALDPALPMYTAQADPSLLALAGERFPAMRQGITFTAAGFYGPQGRALGRVPVRWPDLPQRLAGFEAQGFSVLNMEMETAGILGLGQALGHGAGSLSTILANRATGVFHPDPGAAVDYLIAEGLQLMRAWCKDE